jgi:hypothetical protein
MRIPASRRQAHVYSLVRAEPEKSTWRITGVLIVGGLGVAIGFPSVDAALGLLGATCSVSLSFIIPALLYRRLVVARDGVAWRAAPRVLQARALILFGVLAALLSIPVQLWELLGEHATNERHYVPRPAGIPVPSVRRTLPLNDPS